MRHYTCDVCGGRMPESYERNRKKESRISTLCSVDDVCERCEKVGSKLPVHKILLGRWQDAVAKQDEAPEKTPDLLRAKDHPELFAGRGGSEKSKIHTRLVKFRGDPPKLGCWNELSAATGGKVSADELRRIVVDGESPKIEVWRLIDKALDKLEASDG